MEPEIQKHILDQLSLIQTGMATNTQMTKDAVDRLDKIGPWVKTIEDKVVVLQTTQAVTIWKLGSASAVAGAALTFGAQWLGKKLLGM